MVDVTDLEKKLTDQFAGVLKPLAGAGTNYMHLANVSFRDRASASAGVMLVLTFVQAVGYSGSAIMSFNIDFTNHVGTDSKCVVLNCSKTLPTSVTTLSSMSMYVVAKSETSAEIWVSTNLLGSIISSMRLIGGNASIGYIIPQNQTYVTSEPSNATVV